MSLHLGGLSCFVSCFWIALWFLNLCLSDDEYGLPQINVPAIGYSVSCVWYATHPILIRSISQMKMETELNGFVSMYSTRILRTMLSIKLGTFNYYLIKICIKI